jgi:AraC-like DNA-binding protein
MVNLPPKDPQLVEHILYYYFFSSEDLKFEAKFTHYPHYRTTLNIYLHSDIHLTQDKRLVRYDTNANIKTVFTNNRFNAKEAQINGKFNIIGICFNPLGWNHFVEDNFYSRYSQASFFFDDYWPNQNASMKEVFKEKSIEKKVELLDNFFIKFHHPLLDDRITKIVEEVLRQKGQVKVNELEHSFEISRRTILRLFQKNLACSIKEFKRIVKFRSTLDYYQSQMQKPSLTELSYTNNYYDQSDFIHHFKSLAGEVPKEVLKKIITVGQRDLYWKFKANS